MNPKFRKLLQSQIDRRRLQAQRALTLYNEAKRADPERGAWGIYGEIAEKLGCDRYTAYQLVQFAKNGGVELPISSLRKGLVIEGERHHTLNEAAKILGLRDHGIIRRWITGGMDAPKHEIVVVNDEPTALIRDSELRKWIAESDPQVIANGARKYFNNRGKRYMRRPEDAVDIDAIHDGAVESDSKPQDSHIADQPEAKATEKPRRGYRKRGSCQVSKAILFKEMRELMRTRKRLSQKEYVAISKYGRRYEDFFHGANAYRDFQWEAAHGLAIRQNGKGSGKHHAAQKPQHSPHEVAVAVEEKSRPWWAFWRR